jgi:hypothetical protein
MQRTQQHQNKQRTRARYVVCEIAPRWLKILLGIAGARDARNKIHFHPLPSNSPEKTFTVMLQARFTGAQGRNFIEIPVTIIC